MTDDTLPVVEWTTPARIVREMGVRESLPKTWITKGVRGRRLPAINIGTERRPNYRIRVSDLEEFLSHLAVVPEATPTRRPKRREIPHYV